MALTPQQFFSSLRDSYLLDADDVAALAAEFTPADTPLDPSELARRLVAAGKLTEYQATILCEGADQPLVYGEYVILDHLGAGGMGRVYKALHRRMKRIVALKILPGEAMKDPALVQRFGREVEAAATLSHPNIVTAYDAGEANGAHFLVMEFVEGRDLLAIVRERGMLGVAEAVSYILQAARGLQYAHARGIVHRDIKPANLLLDRNGTVKILDMGIARFTSDASESSREITLAGEVMGSVDYMAPEQAQDVRAADARADIYSLGCSLFRLIAGTTPFAGDSVAQKVTAHREKSAPSLCAIRADATPELDAVFQRMVAKRPEDRYGDMMQVMEALESCRASLPAAPARPATEVTTSTREAETIALTRYGRQAAAGESGRSLVPISVDADSSAGISRRSKAVFTIATMTLLAAAVTAGIFLPRDRQQLTGSPPQPAVGAGGSTTRATAPLDPTVTPGPPVPAAPATTQAVAGGTNATMSATTPSDNPDRRAAEWALRLGGQIAVRPPGSNFPAEWVKTLRDLPPGEFRVNRIMIFKVKTAVITDADLERLRGLTDLEDLNLGDCVHRVTDRGLSAIGQINSLGRINIDGAPITDAGVEHLRPLTHINSLSLASTRITDRGLEPLRGMRKLSRLSVEHTAITDAVALTAKECWPAMADLGMPPGGVSDRALSALADLPSLGQLRLTQTQVSDAQLRILCDFRSLWSLKLDDTQITDAGLDNLHACRHLTALSVRHTKVTPEGVERLRQALPKCQVDSITSPRPIAGTGQ